MHFIPTGRDHATGEPFGEQVDEREFAEAVWTSLDAHGPDVARAASVTQPAATYRAGIERQRTPDLGDPTAVQWTFLVNADDPKRAEIIEVLRPLAEHRHMAEPGRPMELRPDDDWNDWVENEYNSLGQEKRPYYVMLVGGPKQIPFEFESLLDVAACVGRVTFDSLDDLDAYVRKVIRLETEPVATADCVFFATDDGYPKATFYSRQFMAQPLASLAEEMGQWRVHTLFGADATKDRLISIAQEISPAFVYTAGHGDLVRFTDDYDIELAKRINGAIGCQSVSGAAPSERLFTAADVPSDDEPFLEGSVVFQFACFGYGTPAKSGFAHWNMPVPAQNSTEDFVAALPKRLLAHPRGPIGFVGHLDTAWLHGFDDPKAPYVTERWHPRLEPFRTAVSRLLGLQPPGYAMGDLNLRFNQINAQLTGLWTRMQRGDAELTDAFRPRLADMFVYRGDAENYHVMGDPAVQLRVR
jgi:hypothetical protein